MRAMVTSTLLLLAGAAAAQGADVEAQVEGYLGAIDRPIPASAWRALGPEARAVLRRKLDDSRQLVTVRARAADALAIVGNETDGDALSALVAEEAAPTLVRDRALRAAGKLLPEARFVPLARKALEQSPDRRLRAAAAAALVERQGASGCAQVKAHAARAPEKDRALYARTLKRCQE